MMGEQAMIKIGILGCAGRMGRALLAEVDGSSRALLSGGTVRPGASPLVHTADGRSFADSIDEDAAALFARSDVLIDFTSPKASLDHLALACSHEKPLVLGTTGFTADQQADIDDAARTIPILQAANFSLGISLLSSLVRQAARALGPEFDAEILEMHHRHKVDAPSGTALALGRAVAMGRGVDLDEMSEKLRDGQIGPRVPGRIGFATLRGGDVVGEHQVIFAGMGERLVLSHLASDRQIFARGAVHAALWLATRWQEDQTPGLFDMADVLGL